MSKHDDAVIAALYGRAYGPAHADNLVNDEAARSALDPTRRLSTASDDLSQQVGFSPARAVFGAVDQYLGIRPGVAGLPLADDPDFQDWAETAPAGDAAPVDETAAPDIVGTEMSDGWHDTVAAYAASHADFTTDQVLIEAFGMVPEYVEKSDQMRVAEILRALGFESHQKRVNGERQNLWNKLS